MYPLYEVDRRNLFNHLTEIPIPKEVTKPVKPSEPYFEIHNITSFTFLASAILWLLCFGYPNLIGLSIAITGIGLGQLIKSKSEYSKQSKEHKNSLKLYHIKLRDYENNKVNTKDIKELNKNPEALPYHIEKCTIDAFSNQNEIIIKDGKKGYSEDKLLEVLKDIINNYYSSILEVQENIAFQFKNERNKLISYQPDISLFIKKLKTHVVIEIDEMYELENGEPIHFEDRLGEHIDSARNEKFIYEFKCLLFRFTETQVVKDPTSCVVFILKTLMKDFPFLGVQEGWYYIGSACFDGDSTPKKEAFWSYDKAKKMAIDNYRQKLLGLKPKKYEYDDLPF